MDSELCRYRLVAYFSVSDNTATVAKNLADAIGADIYKIEPKIPYTSNDLDWNNPNSRCSVEMRDPSSRPELNAEYGDLRQYGVMFLGFPTWMNDAPRIINTFLESNKLFGVNIVLFSTSEESDLSKIAKLLQPHCLTSPIIHGKVFSPDVSVQDLSDWVNNIKFKCPCCGCYSLDEPIGNYEICEVCFWENDLLDFLYPDEQSACNGVSLNQARQNYLKFGASEEDVVDQVRKPTTEELNPPFID